MPWVQVAKDKKSFVLEPSAKSFTPWGFNYDHDTEGRLIEDYWEKEWHKVEAHFAQMKTLAACAAFSRLGDACRRWPGRAAASSAWGPATPLAWGAA